MVSAKYEPTARFEIETTDVIYLEYESGELLATIYQRRARGPSPGLVDVHGGRWFLNDRSSDHHMNAALAASGIVVVAVDFRLAPDQPVPGPGHRHQLRHPLDEGQRRAIQH